MTTRLHRLLLSLLLAWGMLTSPIALRSAWAQPPDDALGEAAIFLNIFPQLRTLSAPPVIQTGLRVSYQAASAVIGGGAAGGGVVQYDVVASDNQQTLIYATRYTDNGLGQPIPSAPTALVGLPALGEFWIHPNVLVNAEAFANASLAVSRYNKTINGATITVVRFQSQTSGGQAVWEFSTGSGLLVLHSRSTFLPSTGQTSETQSNLIGFRTLALPWSLNTTRPNWAQTGVVLAYTGTQETTVANAGTSTLNTAATVQIQGSQPTWTTFAVESFLQFVGTSTSAAVTGIGQIQGSYWLPQSALGVNLSSPLVVDTDQVTGVQTSLSRAPDGALVMTQAAAAFELVHVYDPTLGVLDSFRQTIVNPTSTQHTELTRTGGSDLSSLNQPSDDGSDDLCPDCPDDAQSAYEPQVQQMYIAYYGRPGDPAGVNYWAGLLAEAGGNWIADLVSAFGDSAEYRNRFGALDDETLINNLFLGLFNRSADSAGLAYYVDLLNGSNISGYNPELRQSNLAQIALDIANGVQPGTEDATTLSNKLTVAAAFTDAIRSTGSAYSDNEIPAAVDLISAVTAQAASVATAQSAIAQMTGSAAMVAF